MVKTNKTKSQKQPGRNNPLESLKDIATTTAKQMKEEAGKMSQNFMEQLLGVRSQQSFSGEIVPGEAIEINEVLLGQHEESLKLRKRTALEKKLVEEEKLRTEKKTNELKIQLRIIQEEMITLSEKTEGLAEETQIAAMQAPIEPGLYHVIFFEKLLEFIKSFSKKIEEARIWLHGVNTRTAKKNAWGANYKRHGAKYLLSGEHYLTRSAG